MKKNKNINNIAAIAFGAWAAIPALLGSIGGLDKIINSDRFEETCIEFRQNIENGLSSDPHRTINYLRELSEREYPLFRNYGALDKHGLANGYGQGYDFAISEPPSPDQPGSLAVDYRISGYNLKPDLSTIMNTIGLAETGLGVWATGYCEDNITVEMTDEVAFELPTNEPIS